MRPFSKGILLEIFFLAVVLTAFFLKFPFHQQKAIRAALNFFTFPYFSHSVVLQEGFFDRSAKLHLRGLQADFQFPKNKLPVEIREIHSLNPVTDLFWGAPLFFKFKGARLRTSVHEGIQGLLVFQSGSQGFIEIRARILGMDLEELRWLNPDLLKHSHGVMAGELFFFMQGNEEPRYDLKLRMPEPGGEIPKEFLNMLLSYLPAIENQARLSIPGPENTLVRYQKADVAAFSAGTGKMKVVLHAAIPDYNLQLNLNLDIRTDSHYFFQDMARLMSQFEAPS